MFLLLLFIFFKLDASDTLMSSTKSTLSENSNPMPASEQQDTQHLQDISIEFDQNSHPSSLTTSLSHSDRTGSIPPRISSEPFEEPEGEESVQTNINLNHLHENRSRFIDKEADNIPSSALVLPNGCVRSFKKNIISLADTLSVIFKVSSGLCGVVSAFGVGDYITDSHILSKELKAQIIILSTIGGLVFKRLEKLLSVIKLRDELHLRSYIKKEEEDARRLERINTLYSEDDIHNYLKSNNRFLTLPKPGTFGFRSFLHNSTCIFESILGLGWAITAGLSISTITSGVVDKNLLGLNSMNEYRELTIILGTITGIIIIMDKKRENLKKYCEQWINNYNMLCYYFVHIMLIPEEELRLHTRYVPEEFINSNFQERIQEAQNRSNNDIV